MAKRKGAGKRRTKKPPKPQAATTSFDPFFVVFYCLLCLLCFFTFKNIVDNYLFKDDYVWLASARYRMDIGNVLTYRVIGFFRPLINLSFFSMERIAPGNIPAYYYQNITMHFINSILVFHFVLALMRDRTIAATTAALFLVSSVHPAAVLWISARTTLICTMLLMSSLLILIRTPFSRTKLAISLILFVLALTAKETAVVGAALVGLLYLLRRGKRETSPNLIALISFAAVTVIYLIVRQVVIGQLVQSNWGPGLHAIRNIAGGGVYQLFPWVIDSFWLIFSIALGTGLPTVGKALQHTTNAVFPEILIIPFTALLWLIARVVKKQREMLFAVLWMLVCLVPSSFLKFRFWTMDSFAHDRYYYLSSVGACLAIVLSLSPLWEVRKIKKYGRVAAAVVLAVLLAWEVLVVKSIEVKWDTTTRAYKETVFTVIQGMDQSQSMTTCAVESGPMRFKYLRDALELERPGWNVVQVEGGVSEAVKHKPCVFVQFVVKNNKHVAYTYYLE
jgi:hypothetical protein